MKKTIFVSLLVLTTLSIYCQNIDNISPQEPTYHVGFYETWKAANAGYTKAQGELSIRYLWGYGIERDHYKALSWAQKAAEKEDTMALYVLGVLYYEGKVVKKDIQRSLSYQLKAAEKGGSRAQYALGLLYAYGDSKENIDKDPSKAELWLTKSAQRGLPPAVMTLARYYLYDTENYNKGVYWLKKVAENDKLIKDFPEFSYSEAQRELGRCYRDGIGVIKDNKQAEFWLQKAIDNGNIRAYSSLARLYAYNYGDFASAHKYADIGIQKTNINEPSLITWPLALKGLLYLDEGKIEEALNVYNECMEKNINFPSPTNVEACSFASRIEEVKRVVDVDNPTVNNPQSNNKNTFAVIVANEHYKYEKDVQYAQNDGNVFRTYCNKVMGIPNENIHYITDATLNNIRYEVNWLKKVLNAYKGKGKAIFYYAGHGIPDEKNNQACMLPTDGYGNDAQTGYRLDNLYADLGEAPSQSTVVFLDACFSGTRRDGEMMTDVRGVAIKAKATNPTGNIIVFSAAQGDETAYPYDESKHGMFTFFLLNKLKETNGDVTLKELGDYISEKVSQKAIVSKGKSQTPTVMVSNSIGNDWITWKLK